MKFLLVLLTLLCQTSTAHGQSGPESSQEDINDDDEDSLDENIDSDPTFYDYKAPNRSQLWGVEFEGRGNYLTASESKAFLIGTTIGFGIIYSMTPAYSLHLNYGESKHSPVSDKSNSKLTRQRVAMAVRFHISPINFGPVFIEAGTGYQSINLDYGSDREKQSTASAIAMAGFGIEADFNEMLCGYLISRYIWSPSRSLEFTDAEPNAIGAPTVEIAIGITTFWTK